MTRVTCAVCGWSAEPAETPTPRITWCPGCATGITTPPPTRVVTTDEIFLDPTGGYADRLGMRPQYLREAAKRVDWVRSVVPRGRLLEIGAATGEFVHVAERAGFDVTGLETSGWAAEHAEDLTRSVEHLDLAAWRETHPDVRFDAVVLFHTLEHFHQPAEILKEAGDVLAPGGRLFVEVPNGGARDARPDGTTWWASSLNDHVFHFTATSLARLLRDNGYREIQTRELTIREYETLPAWLQRRRAWLRARRPRPSRDLLRAIGRAPH